MDKKVNEEKLLEELHINEEDIKRIKKILKKRKKPEKKEEQEKVSNFVRIANIIFRNLSLKLAEKDYFKKEYKSDLRKSDIPLILSSYLSTIFFITLIVLILSLGFSIYISIKSQANIIITLTRNISLAITFSILIFLALFFYPKIKIKSEEREIEAELPFATLYMASIVASGVQPVKALELLSNSREYKSVSKQIRKVTNQINLLGMNLVSAIKSANKYIASKKLVELLNGLATNITTGGDLKKYLEEKARQYLVEYKVTREKFNVSAGIYADIYTGLLIAGPLMFMLVLVLISMFSQTIAGISLESITLFGIFGLIIANIAFLIYLQIVTPPI